MALPVCIRRPRRRGHRARTIFPGSVQGRRCIASPASLPSELLRPPQSGPGPTKRTLLPPCRGHHEPALYNGAILQSDTAAWSGVVERRDRRWHPTGACSTNRSPRVLSSGSWNELPPLGRPAGLQSVISSHAIHELSVWKALFEYGAIIFEVRTSGKSEARKEETRKKELGSHRICEATPCPAPSWSSTAMDMCRRKLFMAVMKLPSLLLTRAAPLLRLFPAITSLYC